MAAAVTARRGDPALYPAGEDAITVWVAANPIHANLVVPRAALSDGDGPTARALRDLPPGDWVSVGWGDAVHYRERGATFARLLDLWRSFLAPRNPAVILMIPLKDAPTPARLGRTMTALRLSPAGVGRLRERLDASFRLRDGEPIGAGRGGEPASRFYESVETSDLTHLCNHWVAGLLDAAGVPTTPVIDIHAFGLLSDLRLRAGAVPDPRRPGEREAVRETPPVYSGRFAAEDGGTIRFDAYATAFDQRPWSVAASEDIAIASTVYEGRTWADRLGVAPDSLVALRTLATPLPPGGPCGDRPTAVLALGSSATPGDKRWTVHAAGIAPDGTVCSARLYRQP